MRKLRRYIERLLPVVAVLALASCSLDEIDEVKKPTDQGDRWGSLTIESLVINTDNESLDRGSNSTRTDGDNGTASAGSKTFKVPNPNNVAEDLDNYWIEVFDADGNVVDINGDATTGTGMKLAAVNALETTIKLIDGETDKTLKGIVLPPGQYTVWAYKDSTKDKSIANVAEDKKEDSKTTTPAYYMGNQTVEVVSAEDLGTADSTPVAITCKLAQTLVTVEMSADMLKWFDETNSNNVQNGTPLQTIVTIAPENPEENVDYSYTFPYSSNHGETDDNGVVVDGGPFVYFKDHAGAKGNTLSFKMEGVYLNVSVDDLDKALKDLETNTESTYKENLTYVSMEREITNVTAAQWRQISFDIDHNTEGDVQFEVTISSYVFDKEIDVDVQTLFFGAPDKYQEETVPDIDPSAPVVTINTSDKSTNAVIAADLMGYEQWSSLLQMTVTPNNETTVTEVYADIESNNKDLMSALEDAGYTDGRVNFLSDTSTASETLKYFEVDASDPSSKVVVTLTYNGMNALQNDYKGTHSVRVWAKDSEERLNFTDLTITSGRTMGGNIGSASGGSGGGEEDPTVGPSVVWTVDRTPTDAITISAEDQKVIKAAISSETGITGLRVKIISELLDAEELETFNLAVEMDLFNPKDAVMETRLRAFGFLPIENKVNVSKDDEGYSDAVAAAAAADDDYRIFNPETGEKKTDATSPLLGKKAIDFEITDFMPLLAALQNEDGSPAVHTFELYVTDESGTRKSTMVITCTFN